MVSALLVVAQNEALQGQKKTTEGEEVENATHDGPRAQTTPHPGGRHGCLSDPGPQRSDRTVRHSAGEPPALSPPSLADAAADTVDHSSLAFLLKVALQLKKGEEEEARKMEMEQVQTVKEEWRARRNMLQGEFLALLDLESRSSLQERRLQELLDVLDAHGASKPSSGPRRKKRKKRKRRLPRVPRHGGRRPGGHAARVPAVLPVPGASVSVPRQSVGHSSCATETDTLCSPWVGCFSPVVAQRQLPWWSSFLCFPYFRNAWYDRGYMYCVSFGGFLDDFTM